MKQNIFVKRATSFVLILAMMLGVMPLPNADAIEVSEVVFNPATHDIEVSFDLQYTQLVTIQVFADGEIFGNIITDKELTGYDGPLGTDQGNDCSEHDLNFYAPVPVPPGFTSAFAPLTNFSLDTENTSNTIDSSDTTDATDTTSADNVSDASSEDDISNNASENMSDVGMHARTLVPHSQETETDADVQNDNASTQADDDVNHDDSNGDSNTDATQNVKTPLEDTTPAPSEDTEPAAQQDAQDNPMVQNLAVKVKPKKSLQNDTEPSIQPVAYDIIPDPEKPGNGHHVLIWDGRIGGIPVFGLDPDKDTVEITLKVCPQGYPTRHTATECWIWSRRYIQPINFRMDYGIDCPVLYLQNTYLKGELIKLMELYQGPGLVAIAPDLEGLDGRVQDPVDMVDGGLISSYTDLRLEGTIPLSFIRYYNSRWEDGALGRGFTHSYEYNWHEEEGIIFVSMPGGYELHFLRLRDSVGGGYHALQNSGFTLENSGAGLLMTHEDGAQFDFADDGTLSEVRNPNGVTVATLSYNGDELSSIHAIAGRFDFTWENGHIAQVMDSAGRTSLYDYDGDLLVAVTNPDGDSLEMEYDSNGYLTQCKDFNGEVYLQNTYDELGRVTEQVFYNANVPTTATFAYDDENRVNIFTNSQGRDTYYYYDEHRNLTHVEDETDGQGINSFDRNFIQDYEDALENKTQYEYSNDRVTQATAPDGGITTYSYTPSGRLKTIKDAENGITTYSYDGRDNVTAVEDANGHTTSYMYNGYGMVTSQIDAEGNTTSFEYDANGRLIKTTNAASATTQYRYDDAGRLVETIDALNNSTKYMYSDAGKLIATKDALGNETKFAYNGNGFTTKTTDALGGEVVSEYGTNGQVLSTTDQNDNTTIYSYDDDGMISCVTDALGGETKYTYDTKGRLTEVTDADGGTTAYEYDALDRIVKTIDAEGHAATVTYDNMGRTEMTTDANGNITSYEYDKLGRTSTVTDALDGVTRYNYDRVGNLLSTTDANNVTTYTEYDRVNRVTKEIDGESNETLYTYDGVGRVTKVTDAMGGEVQYQYDAVGNLIAQIDAKNNTTKYEYDALYRRVLQINADNTRVATEYDVLGRVIAQENELGDATTYTYDAVGNHLSIKDPMNNVTLYKYNEVNQLIATEYADGGVVTQQYTPAGRLAKNKDAMNNVTTYTYDAVGRQETMTNAEGVTRSFSYDPVGNQVQVKINGVAVSETEYDACNRTTRSIDGLGNATEYTYDAVGNLLKTEDKLGNATTYTYDNNYRRTKTTDAMNGETTTIYDKLGRTVQSTDAEGNASTSTYDPNGNTLTRTDALGNTVSYTYDKRNRQVNVEDALGAKTTSVYSLTGQLLSSINHFGTETVYTYDKNGNMLTVTNGKNETSIFTYNNMNRQVADENALHHKSKTVYDLNGNVIESHDRNHNVTTYTYDGLNRMVTAVDAEGGMTQNTYDDLGNVATFTTYGGNGQLATTRYTYDVAGNLLEEHKPSGNKIVYIYDAMGNMLTKTDRDGKKTEYTYDALYRMTSRTDADDTATFAYDKVGNRVSATDKLGTVAFTLDNLYRTIKVTNADGQDTAYSYDANGNRLYITYPDGQPVTSTYNVLGWMTNLTDHDGETITYSYDVDGNVIKERHSDGSTTEYDYNSAGLTTQVKEIDLNFSTRRDTRYGYDDDGNLTSENRDGVRYGALKRVEMQTVLYGYDKANRLVKTITDGVSQTFTYDKASNLLSDGENTFTYDLENRIATKNGAAYTYDKSGNLLSDGENKYTYNAQNKLALGKNADGEESEYTYNALGARLQNIQRRGNWNVGHQNILLDNGSDWIPNYTDVLKDYRHFWQPAWETEVGTTVQNDPEIVTYNYVTDYQSMANRDIMVEAEGQYVQRYVYDQCGARISAEFDYADDTHRSEGGENIVSDMAQRDVSKVYYRRSLLDSTLFAVDGDGDVIVHMTYDAWGNPQTETKLDANYAGIQNLNNFTGYTWDETLGLYFAQNRFYDAETHRFTQEDPIKDGANWYVYCENNPGVNVDVWGLSVADDKILIGPNQGSLTNEVALKVAQKWLVDLGYLPENLVKGHYGENNGGHTQAAVQLFLLNYQKTFGVEILDPQPMTAYTYLMIANAVVDAKYAGKNKYTRTEKYDVNKESVRGFLNYQDDLTCYRSYSGVMGNYHSITDSNPSASQTYILAGEYSEAIHYFDYTTDISNVLLEEGKEFTKHPAYSGMSKGNQDLVSWAWFAIQVRQDGPWDVKLRDKWEDKFSVKYYSQHFRFYFNGNLETAESIGNIAYGYFGKKAGFFLSDLKSGSAITNFGRADDSNDDVAVEKGFNLVL